MTLALLTALSTLVIVSGLICVLKQLINSWCDPERPDTGKYSAETASSLNDQRACFTLAQRDESYPTQN